MASSFSTACRTRPRHFRIGGVVWSIAVSTLSCEPWLLHLGAGRWVAAVVASTSPIRHPSGSSLARSAGKQFGGRASRGRLIYSPGVIVLHMVHPDHGRDGGGAELEAQRFTCKARAANGLKSLRDGAQVVDTP